MAAMSTAKPAGGDEVDDTTLGREHRRHRAFIQRGRHQVRAGGNHRQPVLEAEHAGHARRDVLAKAVAGNERGLDAPRPPQFRQRILEGEQHGLRVGGLVNGRRSPDAGYRTDNSGRSRCGRKRASHFSSVRLNVGCVSNNCRPMPACCAPSPANRNAISGRLAWRRVAVTIAGDASPGGERQEGGASLLGGCRDNRRPFAEVGAAGVRRVAHVRERQRRRFQVRGQPGGRLAQGRLGLPRQRQHVERTVRGLRRGLAGRRFANHDVRVGAAETKGTDTGQPAAGLARPRRRARRDVQGQSVPVDMRGRLRRGADAEE